MGFRVSGFKDLGYLRFGFRRLRQGLGGLNRTLLNGICGCDVVYAF